MSHKKLLIFFTILLPLLSSAQCRDFTEQQLIPKLGDYLLNGRYHSFIMKEGDEILIFKTLSSGIKYKFVVGAEEKLSQHIIFVIRDGQDNTIFDNRKKGFTTSFEYEPKQAQRIKIYIKIPQLNDPPNTGCVGLVIGMKKAASR